jgi:hypothetical protein
LLGACSVSKAAPIPVMPPQPGQGCTVFYASEGGLALAGNNEDSFSPLTRAWFIPASDECYGRVYFGYDDLIPQGGLNDQGLFFDGLWVPYKALGASAEKPDFPGGPIAMVDEVMARSATVDEVVAYFERYNRLRLETGQLFFGDKTGNSVIVEGDAIIRKKGTHQIATNFRQSENPDPPYFCERYNTADEHLSQSGIYSVELFRQILDATHQDQKYVQTVYSQVYDLKNGLIYVYLFHDFENGIVLNLADELAKGPRTVSVASLFPENLEYAQWTLQLLDQWKSFYTYKIDTTVKPASLGSLVGKYRVLGGISASTVRIYLEKDQLFLQKSNELPLELYPDSSNTVFQPFYNGIDLKLAFQHNLLGQVTGAQAKLVNANNENEIAESYTLSKTWVLSDDQFLWLGLLIMLIILTIIVLAIRKRRAGHAI